MRLPTSLSAQFGDTQMLRWGLLLSYFGQLSHAITFTSAPAANLDLSNLGRVGLVGDFSGISLFEYEGQNENGFLTNGSQSLLTRYPNGGFAALASADAGIETMCVFTMQSGEMAGIVIGGNFTSLGGIQSPGAALFNPNTSTVVPLSGISGQVYALLCDQDTNTVYVGGNFKAANSTNAIAWVGTAGWSNLPFAGFNGPVTSITKASNGHVVFGGSFTGLGNATGTLQPDQQIINIANATLTTGGSSTSPGFGDPSNIVCKTNSSDGPGNTWLLADNRPGFWNAEFGFGFNPSKLRLYNTHEDGRGTKTWRYTAFPLNGIMNFTYTDPLTGQNASCTSECPLSNDSSIPYQDFHFVNDIGMNGFQIDISDWYGSGAGLDGIELFQNEIFSYAVNAFNEPSCANIEFSAAATFTGPWAVTPSRQSSSEYLSVTVNETATKQPQVIFLPDIKQSGNYSVNIYTPGCAQDNSCLIRGQVNITGSMASTTTKSSFQSTIFQTNDFDKYDQIYFGYIEAATSSFRPSVTLAPVAGQKIPNLSVVAQRVGFTLISSSGGLNNIFEYDPSKVVVDTSDFANSTFDQAGMDLETGSEVNSMISSGQTTYVGGNFSTSDFENVFQITQTGSSPLAKKGLNGEVLTMFLNDTNLFVGGVFTNTSTEGISGLNNVAVYDTSGNSWAPLGAGVNGLVQSIVPLQLNITSQGLETAITVTGEFTEILAFGNNKSIEVTGFAVWVPSQGNWLQNLNGTQIAINGELTSTVEIPGGGSLLAGSLTSSQLRANGAVALSSQLSTFPVQIQQAQTPQTSSLSKRATGGQNITGVTTGLFFDNNGLNMTILGGHFTATGSDGSDISNLVFINGTDSPIVTGLGPSIANESTVLALAVNGDKLFIGGSITGTVNSVAVDGLLSYDLLASDFTTQPPALAGGSVSVNTISTRSKTGEVYVGGSFSSAGSFSCPAVCIWTPAGQWQRPGTTLGGVANIMTWSSSSTLLVGGDLTLNGVSVSLVNYDANKQIWTEVAGASAIPGPVTTLAAADSDVTTFWVAGTAANGTTFLMNYDGSNWNSVGDSLGDGTNIRGLQVLSLTQSHSNTDMVSSSETLMVLGALMLPGFGNASAALYNGTSFEPFVLTSTDSNTGGSLAQFFSQEQNFFSKSGKHLAVGFVVLIALAIALALIFLLVVAGVIAERIRRKRDGYMPAPTSTFDRNQGMSRIPPDQLFGNVNAGRDTIERPHI